MDSYTGPRNNRFLNAGILFWMISLVTWYYGYRITSFVCFLLLSFFFITHFLQERIAVMFRKNKAAEAKNEASASAAQSGISEQKDIVMPGNNTLIQEEKSGNTVIASSVRFEGNINASGQLYVYGTVVGNIDLDEGMAKIMRNGLVEGNIQSRELIVDGHVKGHCRAESIDICENGRVDGALIYAGLSIKKGGVFTGQAEQIRQPETAANVVDLKQELAPAQEDLSGKSAVKIKKNG